MGPLTALFAAALLPVSYAGTVTTGDPLAGGIGYRAQISLSLEDTASFARHIGAWSWEDNSLFDPGDDPVGWTHSSDWLAVTLSAPTTLTLRLERNANVPWPSQTDLGRLASIASMFPSFTVWSGWDNDLAPQAFADLNSGGDPVNDWHTYNNDGAVDWAEDLTYLGHVSNSTETFAELTFPNLPAGQYSVVIGSNAPANDTDRQGYLATFTTVPEPASALFLGLGALALGCRRRRAGSRPTR
jgi:hypothetical protein